MIIFNITPTGNYFWEAPHLEGFVKLIARRETPKAKSRVIKSQSLNSKP